RAGNIPSSDLSFSITTGKLISGGEISSVTVYVYYEWDSFTPLACLEDAISVIWDEDFIFKENSFTAKHYSFADSLTEALSQPDEQNQQGLGWYIDLQNSSAGSYGSGHFSLLPKASLQDGTTYLSQVIANYGHKKLPFQGISLSAEDFGVQIINDDASCAASSSFRHD
ncbi:MAG: hypothetical protein Q4B50_05340, partial [Bacillota bacterium]|nr:hypothetical protein [Bacillota bacterium]